MANKKDYIMYVAMTDDEKTAFREKIAEYKSISVKNSSATQTSIVRALIDNWNGKKL